MKLQSQLNYEAKKRHAGFWNRDFMKAVVTLLFHSEWQGGLLWQAVPMPPRPKPISDSGFPCHIITPVIQSILHSIVFQTMFVLQSISFLMSIISDQSSLKNVTFGAVFFKAVTPSNGRTHVNDSFNDYKPLHKLAIVQFTLNVSNECGICGIFNDVCIC